MSEKKSGRRKRNLAPFLSTNSIIYRKVGIFMGALACIAVFWGGGGNGAFGCNKGEA